MDTKNNTENNVNQDVRTSLFNENVENVRWIAKAFSAKISGVAILDEKDFVSVGLLALWQVTGRYDGRKDCSFWTYACRRVKGAMFDELRHLDIVSRGSRKLADRVRSEIDRLESQFKREVTPLEACRSLNLSDVCIKKFLADSMISFLYLNQDYTGEHNANEIQGDGTLMDIIADKKTVEASSEVMDRELKDALHEEMSKLDPQKQKILTLYFFKGQSLLEISSFFKVTEGRVWQIIKEAQKILFRRLQHREFTFR